MPSGYKLEMCVLMFLYQRSSIYICAYTLVTCFVVKPAPPAATVAGMVGSGSHNYYSKPLVKTMG